MFALPQTISPPVLNSAAGVVDWPSVSFPVLLPMGVVLIVGVLTLLRGSAGQFFAALGKSGDETLMWESVSVAKQKRREDMKLAFARIVTKDVTALVRFYREITGITPVTRSQDYVEFPTEGLTLAISSQRAMDLYGAGATTPASNRSAILDFQVEDVDKEHARLRGIIGALVMEPTNQPWGNRSMLFRDPDGNLINFFAPIQRTTT